MSGSATIDSSKIYHKEQDLRFETGYRYTEAFLSRCLHPDVEETLGHFLFRTEREKDSIRQFLYQHSFLSRMLIDGVQRIRSVFGSQAQLFLELERDPEENFEEVFVVIQTNKNLKDALDLLERLHWDWFLEILPETKNLLNLTVETKNEI